MTPTRRADATVLSGRWQKAKVFADAAALFRDAVTGETELADAYVTLAVHSGIAAADAICIAELLVYSPSGNHQESLSLLRKADREAERHLSRLLNVKTGAGYGYTAPSTRDVETSARAHIALLQIARSKLR